MGHSPSPPPPPPDSVVDEQEARSGVGESPTEALTVATTTTTATTTATEVAAGSAAPPTAAAPDSLWSSFLSSTLGVFDGRGKETLANPMHWTAAVRKAVSSGPVKRLQECILGFRGSGVAPGATIWFLGVCYGLGSGSEEETAQLLDEFMRDFSSRIWITYRRGFEAIGSSKLTSDQGWGCMIRSGQMLCAQALVCHRLGRNWRRTEKPFSREYLEILQWFGDAPTCPFSLHNFISAGSPYGLAAGSWLGPYALCRAIEALALADRESSQKNGCEPSIPLAVYVVSGDADGERGGAPVLCIEKVISLCTSWSESVDWSPVLILVPLVLGLDKVNPRYLPSLAATFTFPQSLGIAGGKPAASTYIVGVQDDRALYLDPHEVQKVVSISPDNADTDTSSYHCGVVRRMPLDAIDPSLALGFYCSNREEFNDLCTRASELESQSNGAPMFTVEQQKSLERRRDSEPKADLRESLGEEGNEEDWQIL